MQTEKLITFEDDYKRQLEKSMDDVIKVSEESADQRLFRATKIFRSVIFFLGHRKSGVAGITNEGIGNRIFLHQIYNQGMYEAERLLLSGQYFKAMVALKQDMEILTQIRMIKSGQHPDGKTPNMTHAPKGMGRAYGVLNDIGHVSKVQYYRLLETTIEANANGVSPFPIYGRSVFNDSYRVFIWILLEMCRETLILYREMYPEDLETMELAMDHYTKAQESLVEFGLQIIQGTDDT